MRRYTKAFGGTSGGEKFDMNENLFAGGEEGGALEEDVQLMRRKTINVRANNVSNVFMQNMESISGAVEGFKKLSEESVKNDAVFLF